MRNLHEDTVDPVGETARKPAALVFPPHNCGLFLTHNEHRNYYEPIAEWVARQELENNADWLSKEQRDLALATDEVWQLQWYTNTPSGSCSLWAADLDVLLAAASA